MIFLDYMYGLNFFSPNSYVEALPGNVTVCGDEAFKEVIKVEGGCKGRTLIQKDWCPYKKMRKHQGCARTEKSNVKTRREGGHPQVKERGLSRNQSCQHLGLGLLASRTVRN